MRLLIAATMMCGALCAQTKAAAPAVAVSETEPGTYRIQAIPAAGLHYVQLFLGKNATLKGDADLADSCHVALNVEHDMIYLDQTAGKYQWIAGARPRAAVAPLDNGVCLFDPAQSHFDAAAGVLTLAVQLKGPALRYIFASASKGADGSLASSDWVPGGQAKPWEPKTIHFTPQEQQELRDINATLAMLQREETSIPPDEVLVVRVQEEKRAIAAERGLKQVRANEIFDAACRSAGGEHCTPKTEGSDPATWSFTINPKDPAKPGDPANKK
jgi:hypothetical protein